VLALLTDGERCEFIGVAIPERMSLEESVDLAKSLEKLNVPMRKMLINGVTPAQTNCKFCKSRRKMQDEVIGEFKTRFRSAEMYMAPQQPYEIQGAKNLLNHFEAWQKVQRKGAKMQS
jgi:arsenite/tail-anchored protein-transporting ATPase